MLLSFVISHALFSAIAELLELFFAVRSRSFFKSFIAFALRFGFFLGIGGVLAVTFVFALQSRGIYDPIKFADTELIYVLGSAAYVLLLLAASLHEVSSLWKLLIVSSSLSSFCRKGSITSCG
jgi:hypothetical protein